MNKILNVVPSGPALHCEQFVGRVKAHVVKLHHIEHHAIAMEGMTAHAMPHCRNRHFQLLFGGISQGSPNIVFGFNLHNAMHGGAVDTTGIVNRAALLFPCQSGCGCC